MTLQNCETEPRKDTKIAAEDSARPAMKGPVSTLLKHLITVVELHMQLPASQVEAQYEYPFAAARSSHTCA